MTPSFREVVDAAADFLPAHVDALAGFPRDPDAARASVLVDALTRAVEDEFPGLVAAATAARVPEGREPFPFNDPSFSHALEAAREGDPAARLLLARDDLLRRFTEVSGILFTVRRALRSHVQAGDDARGRADATEALIRFHHARNRLHGHLPRTFASLRWWAEAGGFTVEAPTVSPVQAAKRARALVDGGAILDGLAAARGALRDAGGDAALDDAILDADADPLLASRIVDAVEHCVALIEMGRWKAPPMPPEEPPSGADS